MAAAHFINSLLNIQYNLAENLIDNEAALLDIEKQSNDTAIELWKNYFARKISNCEAENVRLADILCSNFILYKWLQEGEVEIIRNFHNNNVPENIRASLKLKVPKIGNEIYKFTEILTKLEFFFKKEILLEFVKGFYITPHGTFGYLRTATFLIEETDLKSKYKYEIACYFCLEEHIRTHHQEYVKENKDNSEFKNELRIKNEPGRLGVFWTFYLEGKANRFYNKITECLTPYRSNNETLIYWAIENENEPSLHYLWENFNDNAIKEDIIDLIKFSLKYDSTNITCYLISQVNDENKLLTLCKEYGHAILSKLLFDDSRWRKYYCNAASYVLKFISKMTFVNAIKTLIVCSFENVHNKDQRRTLLEDLMLTFEVNINVGFLFGDSMETYLKTLLFMEGEESMKELVTVGNIDDLKSLFDTDEIMIHMGEILLAKKQRKLFESFVRTVLVDDAIEKFKIRFFDSTNSRILE